MTDDSSKIKAGRGFFLCYRTTFEHPLFQGRADYVGAWMSLISQAAYQPRTAIVSGKEIPIGRGQLVGGRIRLASEWGWSEKKVRIFLGQLKSQKMIILGQSKGRFANVITICNYGKYQLMTDELGPVQGPTEGPVEGPLSNEVNNKILINCSSSAGARDEMINLILDEMSKRFPDRQANLPSAEQWLTSNLKRYGEETVSKAFRITQSKLIEGEVIGKILPYWSGCCERMQKKSETVETSHDAAMAALQAIGGH